MTDTRLNTRKRSYTMHVIIALMIVGSILLLVSNLNWFSEPNKAPNSHITEETSNNPVIEAKVLVVSGKFVCTCGSCGEESLAQCKCEHAIKVRQIIRGYLLNRKSEEEIIAFVNNNFGGLKDESSKQLDMSSHNELTKYTTIANRSEVLSHFRCPCGKCGMDNLADCSCDHPRGAKEVKKFVDDKIAEGKYSVVEIVDKVEQAYGSRKF